MIDLKLLNKKSIGIIGVRGIGRIYLRELSYLGVKKIFILGKNFKNSLKYKQSYEKELKLKILPCKSIKDLKSKKLDIVCICSPTNTHLKYIKSFLLTKTKLIVEKPLFWENNISLKKAYKINELLFKKYPNKFLTNLPLLEFSKNLKEKFSINKTKIKKINFKYYTSGNNLYKNIAVDLLPHALSFLLYFYELKTSAINIKSIIVKKNIWKAKFYFNKIICSFDFNENVKRKKSLLKISINNKHYIRQQKSNISKFYRTSESIKTGNITKKIENSMSISILNNFKKLLEKKLKKKDMSLQERMIILMVFFLNE